MVFTASLRNRRVVPAAHALVQPPCHPLADEAFSHFALILRESQGAPDVTNASGPV